MKCQKKDPTKISFWLECVYFKDTALTKPRKSIVDLELRSLTTELLEKAIKCTVDNLQRFERINTLYPEVYQEYTRNTLLALDYLYLELGRRVDKL